MNDKLSNLADTRIGILTVIAIFVTVIVGLPQLPNYKWLQPWWPEIIIGSIISGLITYVIVTILKRGVRIKLIYLQNAYDNGYIVQNYMTGFLDLWSPFIYINSYPNFDQLFILHVYYIVLQGGIASKILEKYKEVYPLQKDETQGTKLYQILIDNAYEMFKTYEKQLDDGAFLRLFNLSKAGLDLKNEFDIYYNALINFKTSK
jgi:hypothetical protein